MKYNRFTKSILLAGVVLVGIFFILGCGQKASMEQERAWEADRVATIKLKEKQYKNLDPVTKKKYDALKRKKMQLYNRLSNVYEKRCETEDKSEKETLDIFADHLEKKYDAIQNKMDKILDESTMTCFPKNTKIVMADGSLKEIDTVEKGDKVMIYSIAKDTIGESSVNKKYISTNNHLYIINDSIKTTAYERFLTQDGWKRAHDLVAGDTIFNGNSYVNIDSIYKIKKDLTVYNLNIKSTHNFFVSFGHDSEWFLIHNCGGEGGNNK